MRGRIVIKLKELLSENAYTKFTKNELSAYISHLTSELKSTKNSKIVKLIKQDLKDVKSALAKKKNESIDEVNNHRLYGSEKVYFEVMKPFDLYIAAGGKEPTGQYSTAGPGGNKMIYRDKATKVKVSRGMQIGNIPGGVFLIDGDKRKAYKIITKKGGTGKPDDLRQISSNYVYNIWKNWL